MTSALAALPSDGFLSFLGAVVGALAAGAFALAVQKMDNRANYRNIIREKQIEEYLILINRSCSAAVALDTLARSVSGRTEPGDDASEEELAEARARDAEGVAAVEKLMGELNTLEVQSRRVAAISTEPIGRCCSDVQSLINEYLTGVYHHVMTDRLFVAAEYNETAKALNEQLDNLIKVIRTELEIDKLSRTRRARIISVLRGSNKGCASDLTLSG